jgi:beta-lactamase class A
MRFATLLVASSFVLSACAGATSAQIAQAPASPVAATTTPVPVPTATITPTAIPTLDDNTRVAGVDVSGLSIPDAIAKVTDELSPALRALELRAGEATLTLTPEDIGLTAPVETMVADAQAAGAGARIAFDLQYDTEKLRAKLEELNTQLTDSSSITLISDTKTLSRSFALEVGNRLDIDAALTEIDDRLRAPGSPRRITLSLVPDADGVARPTPEQLQEQIEALAKQWKGVIGVYVYDLKTGQVQASLNENTVFSAASTIKTAIMLHSYAKLDTFTAKQEVALDKMIIESDNLAANTMLAASVGGTSTEKALAGAMAMSALLEDLGLSYTYQYVPFEAAEYLEKRKLKVTAGPKQDGEPPYTDSGRYLRTTPLEMAQIYLYIEQCSRGEGPLIAQFDTLNAERCREMLARLERNGDVTRMMAGLPKGAQVAHKSGWIEDMQSDVGIVRSPGGDFIVAIYVYRPLNSSKPAPDRVLRETIANVARLVYSYYNPVIVAAKE